MSPPPDVLRFLSLRGLAPELVSLCVQSDMDAHGRYGVSWLIIAPTDVLVLDVVNDALRLRRELALASVESARIEPLVGSGRLEVSVGGQPVALIQFSHACAHGFGHAGQWLDRHAHGKTPPLLADVEAQHRRCPNCKLVLPDATQVCPRCLHKGRVLRRLIQAVHPYRYRCALIMALLVVATLVEMGPPQLTRILIDRVLQPPGDPSLLLWLVLGLLGLRVVALALQITGTRLTNRVGAHLVTDLRARLFRKLQEMSVRYYDKSQVGALMTRVGQDTEELRIFISHAIQGVLQQLMLVVFIGCTLFAMSPSLGFFVLLPAPLVVVATARFWKYVMPHINRYWSQRSSMNTLLNAVFSGVRVVKAFAQEQREIERFDDRNQRLFDARAVLDHSWLTFSPMVSFVFGLGGLLIWYFGGRAVIAGFSGNDPAAISVGTLLAFIGYLSMFYSPLTTLAGISDWLTRSLTAAQRIFEVLDHAPDVEDAPDAVAMPEVQGHLEWDAVTFGYEKNNPVLHEISFQVQAGEMIGIVGRSGAGKTTLMNLLCRFYDVTGGAIRLDGVDVRAIKSRDLRRHIGMVLQEPFLFRGSIAENIAYARPAASHSEVMAAARAANAHDFIVKLPEGYDTRLGERGAGLSGGERQRVSIARAILHDPAILILDEATSSVDTETEKLIRDAVADLCKGRTTFAIAHRLSTLSGAHRILVVDKGKVAEMGTPEELMERKGIYHRLVKIQEEMTRGGKKALSLDEMLSQSQVV